MSELISQFERDGLDAEAALDKAAEQAIQEFGLDAAVKKVEDAEQAAWEKKRAAERAKLKQPPCS